MARRADDRQAVLAGEGPHCPPSRRIPQAALRRLQVGVEGEVGGGGLHGPVLKVGPIEVEHAAGELRTRAAPAMSASVAAQGLM